MGNHLVITEATAVINAAPGRASERALFERRKRKNPNEKPTLMKVK